MRNVNVSVGAERSDPEYILDSVQMLGGILRDEVVDDIQPLVFPNKVSCGNCKTTQDIENIHSNTEE